MKLKKLLVLSFTFLTIIPALIISLLLYKSGLDLSKESYTRNLIESIHVQTDFLSQTIESNIISDLRFLQKNFEADISGSDEIKRNDLLSSFQNYLEAAEDRISVCILLDRENIPLYTIGEADELEIIMEQLPDLQILESQKVLEFDMGEDSYSLGIITPAKDEEGTYTGCLISIYDRQYLFKIISSYYEIADTTTYICSENGRSIDLRGFTDQQNNDAVSQGLQEIELGKEGSIDMKNGNMRVSGYYKNINNTPWYLVGLLDQKQIYAFTNQFIWVYILIIMAIVIVSVLLSLSLSKRVVEPINRLIYVMDGYPDSLKNVDAQEDSIRGYYETNYLKKKFLDLMKTIMLVQHNFEGVYQLYQSSDMDDTNIDIDVINQTIHSSKEIFAKLIERLEVPPEACIVERFTRCFCDKDQVFLMNMFENMRDEHLAVTQEGEVYTPHFGQKWFHILTVPMYEGVRLSRLFIQLRDISGYKKQEYESLEKAKREPLTGLLNRSGFTSCIESAILGSLSGVRHGILFIDIDNFKLVNDNFGHGAGDDLLRTVAKVLRENVGSNDIAARFGGDEFAVFLPETTQTAVLEMRQLLAGCLVYHYNKEDISFTITASIGIAVWSSDSPLTLEELIAEADQDMYQVKRKSKQKDK